MNLIGWPLDMNIIRRRSERNTFGMVRRNSAGQQRAHQGWDFFAPVGTPCYAIASGKIELIYNSPDYGLVLVLGFTMPDGAKRYAAYAHLANCKVAQGDTVALGQRVGTTGDSGNARGMDSPDQHLHFEIRTEPRPGMGLKGRVSPSQVFGHCPLNEAVHREGAA